jgi:hypothetical protein
MRSKRALSYVLAALVAGCVPILSLQPLYTAQTLTFDERLLGSWVEDANSEKSTWQFSRLGPTDQNTLPEVLKEYNRVYRLLVQNGPQKGVFTACLVKLDGKLFLDLFPAGFPSGPFKEAEKAEFYYDSLFFVPAHMFFKVDEIGDQLKMSLTDDDKFKDLMKAEPNAIQHQMVENQTVLTAPTKDLQAFVIKHINDQRLFANEVVLSRKPSK